jgi:ParB family chromosome partitioning protein
MATAKAKNEAKPKAPPKPRKKKNEADAGTRGIEAGELSSGSAPGAVATLVKQIEADGGTVIGTYKEPLGGHWHVFAGLPIGKVEPTPFQRDLSDTHVARLTDVVNKLDRFLDPIIAVRNDDGIYWTPNGNHRLAAMRRVGAKSIVALVIPEREVAYKILAMNTEKAHNLKEKALEVVRMARSLASLDSKKAEKDYALEFEEPGYTTIGMVYEKNGRFAGGAYFPIVRRIDAFRDEALPKALELREKRAAQLQELDEAVAAAVKALKEKGFDSPFLKNFVVSRINYLKFVKGDMPRYDDAMEKILASAKKFDASKVDKDSVANAGGGPPEGDEG